MKLAAYIHGNLAVEERTGNKKKIKETRRIVYRKKQIPTQEKLLYLFTIVVCVLVAGVIIWRYAQIYEVNTNIQRIEQEIKMLQDENASLKLEVHKLQDPERLIQKGEALGLKRTTEEEINEIVPVSDEPKLNTKLVYSE